MIRILLGFIVILGIVWLYITNKKKEGLENEDGSSGKEMTSEEAQALAGSIKTQMAAAGVPAIALEETDALFAQLAALIETEVAASGNNREEIIDAENVTPVENTVAPNIPFDDTSFFTGVGFGSAFCGINNKNPTQLKSQCSLLTAENCNATDCCIWVNGTKCVAGDANGPMEMNLDAKYYSHKYQCYGDCASGGTGGGNYGYGSDNGPCADTLTTIPVTCVNDFATSNCASFIIPQDASGIYPGNIKSVTGNFTLTQDTLDMTDFTDMDWSDFKAGALQQISQNPSICAASNVWTKNTDSSNDSKYDDLKLTVVPIIWINQFAADAHCNYFTIPQSASGTYSVNIGGITGLFTIANKNVDMSQFPNMNWGAFKRSSLQLIRSNPNICSSGSNFWYK